MVSEYLIIIKIIFMIFIIFYAHPVHESTILQSAIRAYIMLWYLIMLKLADLIKMYILWVQYMQTTNRCLVWWNKILPKKDNQVFTTTTVK